MDFMPRYMAKNPRYIHGQERLEMPTAPAIFQRMRGCLRPFLGLSAGWLFLAEGQKSSRHCLTIVVRFSEDLSAVSRLQVAVILEDEAPKDLLRPPRRPTYTPLP